MCSWCAASCVCMGGLPPVDRGSSQTWRGSSAACGLHRIELCCLIWLPTPWSTAQRPMYKQSASALKDFKTRRQRSRRAVHGQVPPSFTFAALLIQSPHQHTQTVRLAWKHPPVELAKVSDQPQPTPPPLNSIARSTFASAHTSDCLFDLWLIDDACIERGGCRMAAGSVQPPLTSKKRLQASIKTHSKTHSNPHHWS